VPYKHLLDRAKPRPPNLVNPCSPIGRRWCQRSRMSTSTFFDQEFHPFSSNFSAPSFFGMLTDPFPLVFYPPTQRLPVLLFSCTSSISCFHFFLFSPPHFLNLYFSGSGGGAACQGKTCEKKRTLGIFRGVIQNYSRHSQNVALGRAF